MIENFENLLPKDEKKNVGYSSNEEYLHDEFSFLECYFRGYFEYLKMLSHDFVSAAKFKNWLFRKVALVRKGIDDRLEKTKFEKLISSRYLKRVCKFSSLDWFCVLAGMAKNLNLLDNILGKIENFKLDYITIIKVYYIESNIFNIPDFYEKLDTLSAKMDKFCFNSDFNVDSNIRDFVISNGNNRAKVEGMDIFYPDVDNLQKLDVGEEIAQKFSDFISRDSCQNQYFYVYGTKGIGKKSIVKRVAGISENCLVMFKITNNLLENEDIFIKKFVSCLRESYLLGAILCISDFEVLFCEKHEKKIEVLLNLSKKFCDKIFILLNINESESKKSNFAHSFMEYDEDFEFFYQYVPDLKKIESIEIWFKFLKKTGKFNDKELYEVSCDLSNKFKFTILQIKNTVKAFENVCNWDSKAKLDKKALYECAYLQISENFFGKAVKVEAHQKWDDLVLGESEKQMLLDACTQIKFRHIVYEKWNFAGKIFYGTGLSMLFTGPPGTGKTMAASVVASELGLKLYRVNLSAVVSKYIGETEKNLNEIFDLARRGNVLLLFDETDAIFGKRTEIRNSHDRNANIEISYLLQKIEEFDGVTIMTTNFQNNIDSAFFRRISYVVHFTLPNAEFRKKIWKKIFPKETPLSSDIDFDFLSQKFEISGGSIKNVAIVSAFMAASEGKEKLEFLHILKALKYELKKQGSTVLDKEFGKYSYLFRK